VGSDGLAGATASSVSAGAGAPRVGVAGEMDIVDVDVGDGLDDERLAFLVLTTRGDAPGPTEGNLKPPAKTPLGRFETGRVGGTAGSDAAAAAAAAAAAVVSSKKGFASSSGGGCSAGRDCWGNVGTGLGGTGCWRGGGSVAASTLVADGRGGIDGGRVDVATVGGVVFTGAGLLSSKKGFSSTSVETGLLDASVLAGWRAGSMAEETGRGGRPTR